MKMKSTKKLVIFLGLGLLFLFFIVWWEVYIPKSLTFSPTIVYSVQKGIGDEEIARDLLKQGVIKNSLFFRLYAVVFGQDKKLKAGKYSLSSSMSVAQIVEKLVLGDVIKEKITIIEGWNSRDIAQYLENKNLYSKNEFLDLIKIDLSQNFDLLKDKPKGLSLEGYLFPDTYEINLEDEPGELIKKTLANFDKKLTADLRREIALQRKSVFQIVNMASIIEKEVKTLEDKKIVSGILWKRLASNIPLQVDSTVNYITGKNDAAVSLEDASIDSSYNTYKYLGLPLGPISNPGMDSILAAVYPEKSDYWYYLSANGSGKTIFSKTLKEHNIAKAKYLSI